ncbi:GFA family protein [Phytopseudomonas dryadis]|uniref:Aldehyde-activating protein n=1 Tax=Phytopseudomonas dryadis TaxID=2487520 RepID=A0A4Q9QZ59_9GAMM|nr:MULTISPECIES: GFA family protein [Pseudomonas]TBU91199.1 aldehyde-activating protein [Pseudomonas dryadis]TBV02467.1 aldehyde-activating protein [Pseudomonas dryadis]TBV12700.1 aldehyde-activating protein [Pseudomonas sp. FRB 230]
MTDIHSGGCQCAALRYQFQAPLADIAHCHCSICRRSTGGILVTWISVPLASFKWLAGEPASYASSSSCTRYFCPRCGAHLALFTRISPQTLDVTVATLDRPELAAADRHIWVQSRLPWLRVDPQLPEEEQEFLG